MRVKYRASVNLPEDVAVALVEGECESVILIDANASGHEIAAGLDDLIGEWVTSSWLHVGRCEGEKDLRRVS